MNKVILMGRLTKDPEIRYTGTGEPIAIARYTIAVSRPYKKDGADAGGFYQCGKLPQGCGVY